ERPPPSKQHVCDELDEDGKICGSRFERSEHLKRHKTKHSLQRKYPCPLEGCKGAMARGDNAGDHFKTHLKGPRKGQRNRHIKWPELHSCLLMAYDEREATKMIAKLQK
ncbi:hypothetical protein K470DRAFT_197486, partial [Piedraia hortae CBS 480.64]